MQAIDTLQFTLGPASLGLAVEVRLRRVGERWVARVEGRAPGMVGMSGSAGRALAAALEPLGESAVRVLLADLALLEPSCRVLDVERGVAG